MALIIEFEGKTWHLDKDAITIDEWRELKRKYGLTPRKFDEGLNQADPDVYTFLYWAMLRQNGDARTPLGDHLKPDIIRLNEAVAAAQSDSPGDEEQEADPTNLAGSLPATTLFAGSATGTSASSEPSISSSSPATADSTTSTSDG